MRPSSSVVGRGRHDRAAKVPSLIHAMLLGADCIDDCEVLRVGRTEAVLGHRPMAPPTLGTSSALGHARARAPARCVLAEALRRAWRADAGPGKGWLVIDIDSFIGEVHGPANQGAGRSHTQRLGYHPLLATRSDTGEVLYVRLRKGQANTQRGALRFVEELLARVRRAGAAGQILLRAEWGSGTRSPRGCARKAPATRSASRTSATSPCGSRRSPPPPDQRPQHLSFTRRRRRTRMPEAPPPTSPSCPWLVLEVSRTLAEAPPPPASGDRDGQVAREWWIEA